MSENHWPESSGDVKETAEQRKPVRLGWSFPVNLLKAGLDTELKARAWTSVRGALIWNPCLKWCPRSKRWWTIVSHGSRIPR